MPATCFCAAGPWKNVKLGVRVSSVRARPPATSTVRLNALTVKVCPDAPGTTSCPRLYCVPVPSSTSVFTADTRSAPPRAAAASLTICCSGVARVHATGECNCNKRQRQLTSHERLLEQIDGCRLTTNVLTTND